MPRRQPPSLYRACLDYVAGNMRVPRSERRSAIRTLPQTILEDILGALQWCQPVDYALLCHVLGNPLRFVLLSRRLSPTEEIAHLMHSQLRDYGGNITVLHLSLPEAQYDTFVTTLSRLPRLRNLVLHVNEFSESVAGAITRHCPDLIHLSLYKIPHENWLRATITDNHTYATQVTLNVVRSVLERLALRVFRIPYLTQAVLSMPAATELHLREIGINEELLTAPDRLSHVVTLCPNLQMLTLVLFNGIQIEPLVRLTFLEDLTVIVKRDPAVDFSELIRLLLCGVGWRLRRLRLNAPALDLTNIVRYCPMLYDLHVEKLLQIVNHERRETRSLEQLRALRISLVLPLSLDPHQLCKLLQDYGTLTRVLLHRCYLLDVELQDLISSGTFSKLETLQLVEVYGFSPASLQLLVSALNHLLLLRVNQCHSVSRAHVDELRELVRRLNLSLRIEFGNLDEQRP